jgi:hypothetical protein
LPKEGYYVKVTTGLFGSVSYECDKVPLVSGEMLMIAGIIVAGLVALVFIFSLGKKEEPVYYRRRRRRKKK